MEKIELFDDYINNRLSDAQRSEFEAKLATDEKFASAFYVYLMAVRGICQEVQQDNFDFGKAMKGLSKEQLKGIIGKKDVERPAASLDKPKVLRFRPWMWGVSSVAAAVVIAYTIVLNYEKHSRSVIYDDIYANAQFDNSQFRGQLNIIDITKLDDSQLESKLPEMRIAYQNCDDIDELYLTGYTLAMAYIRLHQPQPALEILNNLVTRLEGDDHYEFEVREMRLIISLLK